MKQMRPLLTGWRLCASTDAACFARASDSPFFRLARAFSWLHIFLVNKTLWISRLCTSDSPSVLEAETNKIYVRTALVLVLVMTQTHTHVTLVFSGQW